MLTYFLEWSESILQILPTHYENLLGKDVKDLIEPQSVDTYNDLMVDNVNCCFEKAKFFRPYSVISKLSSTLLRTEQSN